MIIRRRSNATGFWAGMAVVVVMCAVWVKQVEGFSDMSSSCIKGGVNDPSCLFWGKGGKGGNRKLVRKQLISVKGTTQVGVEPELPDDDQPAAQAPADSNPDVEIDKNMGNNMVIVGH